METEFIIFIIFVVANSIVSVISNLPLYKHNKEQKIIMQLQKEFSNDQGFKEMINKINNELQNKDLKKDKSIKLHNERLGLF